MESKNNTEARLTIDGMTVDVVMAHRKDGSYMIFLDPQNCIIEFKEAGIYDLRPETPEDLQELGIPPEQ